MKKCIAIVIWTVLGLMILIVGGLLLSYVFPRNVHWIDDVRMFFQEKLVRTVGNIPIEIEVVDDLGNIVSADDMLTLLEIQPFIQLLQPGDIMFSATEKYLSNWFIP